MKCYQVNSFTRRGKGGNPAGVVICEDGHFPQEDVMQETARAFGYSETAFVIPGQQEMDLRYFTPECEEALCGHATIAAFKALLDAGLAQPGSDYICRTAAGQVPVKMEKHFISMEAIQPQVRSVIRDLEPLQLIYSALNLEYDPVKIMPACNTYRTLDPMVIESGLPYLIVPIRGVEALHSLTPSRELIMEISKGLRCSGFYAFAFEPREVGIMAHCRGFSPLSGLDEEAAAGTAAAALAYYLNGYGVLPSDREAVFLQGESMDRASELVTYIKGTGDDMKILVGGDAEIIGQHDVAI